MSKNFKRVGAVAVAAAMSLSIMTTTSINAAASPVNKVYQERFESMYNKIKDLQTDTSVKREFLITQ